MTQQLSELPHAAKQTPSRLQSVGGLVKGLKSGC